MEISLTKEGIHMKKSSKFSKLFYIQAWRTGAVERELAEHVQNGYKPVDFQEILFSIWRITFQKSERCPHDYYLFGRFQAGRGATLGYAEAIDNAIGQARQVAESGIIGQIQENVHLMQLQAE